MRMRKRNCHHVWSIVVLNRSYLHFVLEGEGVTVHTGVSFKFTQYNTFLEEKDLSLMTSRARLDVWRFLPHCEDSLKERRQVKSLFFLSECTFKAYIYT